MRTIIYVPILFFFFSSLKAQNSEYSTLLIPENLKENANSVVRNQTIDVDILSQKSMVVKTYKVITILNSKGLSNLDAKEYYSNSERIISIQATIYNAFGREIKKIKKSDFKDQSVADGFSMLSDGRILYLEYTPTDYPFTVVFESETKTTNTAFIPTWSPIDNYFESVQKSVITVRFPSDLGFKYKEYNFDGNDYKKNLQTNSLSYSVENAMAEKPEDFSPSLSKIRPFVKFGLEKFNLEGIEVNAKNWEEFGLSWYTNLLADTEEISVETQNKIKGLVGTETDPIKKAKIIYQYVQDKTRYVSIQLGIGGWKPMLAKDVDRLGYGDCKALTNYTRALLKIVGVTSYYTVIYGASDIEDFDKDFVVKQGNHIILTLPNNDKNLFLECTSQTLPFGFQGDFTDDRYALMIQPDKGKIIKTKEYTATENTQISRGVYAFDREGNITGAVKIKSKGIQYDNIYALERKSREDIDEYYKNHFYWINNLKMEKIKFNNNKEDVEFTEDLQITASGYGKINGDIMMIPINLFDQNSNVPQRYRFRKNPFEISRGFYDEDEFEVTLPDGFQLDAKPDNAEVRDKFGTYKMEIVVVNMNTLLYKRSLLINKGFYDKSDYENYRKFREQIAKIDNSKIVLTKK